MQRELDQRLRETSKSNVLDALHDAHTFQLPKTLVDQEAHALQHEAMRRMGTDDHDRAPVAGFKPLAEKRVRLSLLVQELIGRHQIALDRARVEDRIQEISSPYEVPEEAAQIYRANKEMMAQIESAVLEDQVVDFVIDSAKPNRTKFGFDEFMNMQDSE
jgi:trigger factor